MSKNVHKRKTQKVIIPKGTIDPFDTTVIEIPANLLGQPLVIAKKKESQKSLKSVQIDDDVNATKRSARSDRSVGALDDSDPFYSQNTSFPSTSFAGPQLADLDSTEQNEKHLLITQLEEYQKARRKFLVDASIVASKSNVSAPSNVLEKCPPSCPSTSSNKDDFNFSAFQDGLHPPRSSSLKEAEKPTNYGNPMLSSTMTGPVHMSSGTSTSDMFAKQFGPPRSEPEDFNKSNRRQFSASNQTQQMPMEREKARQVPFEYGQRGYNEQEDLNGSVRGAEEIPNVPEVQRQYGSTDRSGYTKPPRASSPRTTNPGRCQYDVGASPKDLDDRDFEKAQNVRCAPCCVVNMPASTKYNADEDRQIENVLSAREFDDIRQQIKDARRKLENAVSLASKASLAPVFCSDLQRTKSLGNPKSSHAPMQCPMLDLDLKYHDSKTCSRNLPEVDVRRIRSAEGDRLQSDKPRCKELSPRSKLNEASENYTCITYSLPVDESYTPTKETQSKRTPRTTESKIRKVLESEKDFKDKAENLRQLLLQFSVNISCNEVEPLKPCLSKKSSEYIRNLSPTSSRTPSSSQSSSATSSNQEELQKRPYSEEHGNPKRTSHNVVRNRSQTACTSVRFTNQPIVPRASAANIMSCYENRYFPAKSYSEKSIDEVEFEDNKDGSTTTNKCASCR